MRRTRLAIVASHPIQYFVHFYREIARQQDVDLTVLYCSRIGLEPYFDPNFNREIAWRTDLLSGYHSLFLDEAEKIKSSGFRALNNPSVTRFLDQCDPDAILVYGYSQMTQLRTIAWAMRRKIPILMTADSELLQHRSLARMIGKRALLVPLFRRISAFLTVGDNNEDYYRSYGVGPEKVFRTPFTIDEAAHRKARSERARLRKQVRSQLGVADDRLVFLTVGKLSERKRPMDIIAAARKLVKENLVDLAEFWFAGDGVLRRPLEAAITQDGLPVKVLGFLNVDRMPDIYAAADVLVHPSEREPYGLVMPEAACVGLPVICSDRVGAIGSSDILRPGQNVLVYPCGNIDALASHIVRLASYPGEVVSMGARGLEIFEEQALHRSIAGLKAALGRAVRRQAQSCAYSAL